MSRLFLPNHLCANCTLLTAGESAWLTARAGARVKQQLSDTRRVFIQQQRHYVGGANAGFPKHSSKSRIWVCAVGVGIALAVGLKYRTDSANGSCDDKVPVAQRTDRYSAAITVSRELVQRIQVGTQVDLLCSSSCLLLLSPAYLHCISCVCVVVRLRSVLQAWWLGSLWMVLRSGVKVGACRVHLPAACLLN